MKVANETKDWLIDWLLRNKKEKNIDYVFKEALLQMF